MEACAPAFGRGSSFRGCQRTLLARELLAKKILVRVVPMSAVACATFFPQCRICGSHGERHRVAPKCVSDGSGTPVDGRSESVQRVTTGSERYRFPVSLYSALTTAGEITGTLLRGSIVISCVARRRALTKRHIVWAPGLR